MTDPHPFHALLPQHAASLRLRALKLTSNEHRAEDLVQTTFLKAWEKRESYQSGTNLRAWLFTILRNTFFSELRTLRREVEDVDGAGAEALFEEAPQDHTRALNELIAAIDRLPQSQRQPLVLMGAYGFSQLEAANACCCTVGTIKSRVSRGRATLTRLMADDDEALRNSHSPRARVMRQSTGLPRKEPNATMMAASADRANTATLPVSVGAGYRAGV